MDYISNISNPYNYKNFYIPKYNFQKGFSNNLKNNDFGNLNIMQKSKTPGQKKIRQDRYYFNYQNMENNLVEEHYVPGQYNNMRNNFGINGQNNSYGDNNITSKRIEYNINNKKLFKEDKSLEQNELILKIFIYIYTYEKTLSKKNIFNNEDKYYLINPNWLSEFKKYYSYEQLEKQLDSIIFLAEYSSIDLFINDYIDKIPEEARPNYKPFSQKLKVKGFFNPNLTSISGGAKISFIYKGIIFPKKIIDIINILDGDFIKMAKQKNFHFTGNNIYYINNKNIIYGIRKNNALFEPVYIFNYISDEIKLKEQEVLFRCDIKDYITAKKCNTQINYQPLKNGEDIIGYLYIPSGENWARNKAVHSASSNKPKFNNNNIPISKTNTNDYNKKEIENKNNVKSNELNKQNNNNQIKVSDQSINENKNKENQKMQDNTPNPINNIDEGKELLKAFIYIYYYEKTLKEKNIFNNNEKYYLINPDWLIQFKKIYSYNKFAQILIVKEKNYNYSYNNIDNEIDNIIAFVHDQIKFQKNPINNNLKGIITSINMYKQNNNDISYISRGIIFPSKIMNIIKNVYPELKTFQKKKIIFKENYIYYINSEKIIVGIYQKSDLFIPYFVCVYNSNDLEKIEEQKMISSNIKEYLIQRNCDNQLDYQILKNENGKEIGKLIIILQNNSNPEQNVKNTPTNINKRINNMEIQNNHIAEDNNIINIGNQQAKKENELINKINNLNNQIKNLYQELKKKDKQINNNNIEYNKLKQGYNSIFKNLKEQKEEIANLRNENSRLQNNEKLLIILQNQEQEMKNKLQDLSGKDNKLNELNQKYQQLLDTNKKFSEQISEMNKEKENLNQKLKKGEEERTKQKDLINKINNLTNKLNILNQDLQNKNADNKNIINELEKIKNEKNELFISNNEKKNEIKKLSDEILRLQKNDMNKITDNNKMQDMQKKIDNLNNIENEKNIISQKYKELLQKNNGFEIQILKANEEKKKLSEQIKQYESQISNQQELIK